MLHETLNVINEHITDLRSPPSTSALHATANDSGSEYSSHIDQRMSYIQGEETDEEEDGVHTRAEVESWTPDEVAEYLFTVGVEKHHCEVFRDQEITGEVLLNMDQSSLFLKAFELGSVGRRLKTWHKIQALQQEVNGEGSGTRRTTQTYGSEIGSDGARSSRSRTNTLTGSASRLPPVEDQRSSVQSTTKRLSLVQTPRMEPTQAPMSPVSPLQDSPSRAYQEKRPSAASVRDLHHSRRHSSNDFRLTGTTLNSAATPKLSNTGGFRIPESTTHKKEPSFDRNWTMGAASAYSPRPLSSTELPEIMAAPESEVPESTVDMERGYFSGPDADTRRRNVLRKRDSVPQARKSIIAEEPVQQQRSTRGPPAASAGARHSRYGSVDSTRDSAPSTAAQKYYGLSAGAHRRTASTNTTDSVLHLPKSKDAPSPTVTKLDGSGADGMRSPSSPAAANSRQGLHGEWLNLNKPALKTSGLRAISDNADRSRFTSPTAVDSPAARDSPIQSPSTRTGSSTPSAGPSFELDSPNHMKSPSASGPTTSGRPGARRKGKKETSAYQRGLAKISPREAMKDADYSGWMKKKSSNLMTTWKPRLFVLKGRRLAYYYSEDDDQEKGLIDISFHRVLPADNERLTGLHATLTGATTRPAQPAGSHVQTLADAEAGSHASLSDNGPGADSMFIFKLVPPRAGLSRAVNFTKPTVHYFAVPNLKQGRLWMAALMKATIDRDDTQPVTTTYQQKTISLAKARQMRHRPPALMNLDDPSEDADGQQNEKQQQSQTQGNGPLPQPPTSSNNSAARRVNGAAAASNGGLGISLYREGDSGIAGLGGGIEKLGLHKVESASRSAAGSNRFVFEDDKDSIFAPQSA